MYAHAYGISDQKSSHKRQYRTLPPNGTREDFWLLPLYTKVSGFVAEKELMIPRPANTEWPELVQ
jgi:hypothetical protein